MKLNLEKKSTQKLILIAAGTVAVLYFIEQTAQGAEAGMEAAGTGLGEGLILFAGVAAIAIFI